MHITAEQENLINHPIQSKIFLRGIAGTGKTTAGTLWLQKLLKDGIPAREILIFVPQRALANPYLEKLREDDIFVNSLVNVLTLGGLARRMVDLYWPMISPQTGVKNPNLRPHFLTLETAQYYMAHIVRPLIEKEGLFESLTLNRNRIYSQILDNLNKAAIVGFPIEEIGDRLKSAWVGDIEQLRVYDDVQHCAQAFRSFCLENNLLDFSLQVEIFSNHLWTSSICRAYLKRSFRHLIVDNLEEDTPISHDILRAWLPDFDSALMIFDEGAGFRYFLGADVRSAQSLQSLLTTRYQFTQNLVNTPEISDLKTGVMNGMAHLTGEKKPSRNPTFEAIKTALKTPEEKLKYFPEMVQWVAGKISDLIEKGTPPDQIAVLAPFMPDVLRFSLSNRLVDLGIPNQAHRPSRALRDEPTTQTLLTLSTIAFQEWEMPPQRINFAFALMQVIEGLDLVRSQLLTHYITQKNASGFTLQPFETVPAEARDRITYRVGARYDHLRNWLESVQQEPSLPLDFFLNRLFGEVLSQPGFNFHKDLNSGNNVARLIESIQKFRWAIKPHKMAETFALGKEYVQMVQDGVIGAQYDQSQRNGQEEAVFLSPAYTFLIRNEPVDVQFWLDVGSPSWYQRLDQPLTQPYVLSRNWDKGQTWTAEDELRAAHQTLERLTLGLLNRCRKKVFIAMSELDVRGFENRGLLTRVINHLLRVSQRGIG
jgi:hypothetical protein